MTIVQKLIQCYRFFRVGGLPATKRFLSEGEHNHIHVLSQDPPIIYLWWGRDDMALHEELANANLTLLYLFPWCYAREELPTIKERIARGKRLFPRHEIIFLCNEEYAVDELRKDGIQAEFIHQNAFINENIFRPIPAISRTHDALYSASLAPYKRHHLAKEIRSLIMLSYTYAGTTTDAYGVAARKMLSHAWWAKDSLSPESKLTTQQIVDLYSRAHVGLCLSAVEGGMFVSMEYMLCGLPIVTTRSRGGRAAFWDDRYVVVCDDQAIAVAAAVADLKSRCLMPEDIRRWTLEKITVHRERLGRLMRAHGANLTCPWLPGSHGITTWSNLRTLGRQIRNGHNVGRD